MSTNSVNFGGGNVTGYFYSAPANTALPDYPTATLPEAWVQRGYISEDGITYGGIRNNEPLKDWARNIVRTKPGEDPQTVQAPIISTDEASLVALFGTDAVTVTAATATHGKVITVDTGKTPEPAAFLFIGRDGDDSFMIGTTKGFINTIDDVTFTATDAITWTATIAAADKFIFVKDDGQTTT
jgi:hypothetical protein